MTDEQKAKDSNAKSNGFKGTGVVEINYDDSGSPLCSDGSDYVYETDVESSSKSTELEKKFLWCLSMCELETIVTGKVEMITTNTTLKNLYDKAHQDIESGKVKSTDLSTRLQLSGLFNSVDHEMQPISVGFVAQSINFSLLTQQNINTLISSMRSDDILRLDNDVSTMVSCLVIHCIFIHCILPQTKDHIKLCN